MLDGLWLVIGVHDDNDRSTVADLLAQRCDRSVHFRGGEFGRWAVRGWVQAGDEPADEAERLLHLRYRLAARVADEYCGAGFTTVVQENLFGEHLVNWLRGITARPRHLVALHANGNAPDDTPRIGLWLDTTALTPEQTVQEILARRTEAVVEDDLGHRVDR